MIKQVSFLAILALPVPALADDIFAEFEMRCLTPMIEVRESDVEGLNLLEDMAGRETWIAEGQDWHLTRAASDAVIQFCAIHGAVGDGVDAWGEAALTSGDWERIDRVPETFRTIFLREPVIEVEIDREGMSLAVIETNSES